MICKSLAFFFAALSISPCLHAFTPAYEWPSDDFPLIMIQDAQVMAEFGIESRVNKGQYYSPSHSERFINHNLSEKEAKKVAKTFCEGSLAGLVLGLRYTEPPYRELSQLSGCYTNFGIAEIMPGISPNRLRAAFELGYEEDGSEKTTTGVLLKGLWQVFECEGEPP